MDGDAERLLSEYTWSLSGRSGGTVEAYARVLRQFASWGSGKVRVTSRRVAGVPGVCATSVCTLLRSMLAQPAPPSRSARSGRGN